MTSEGLVTSLHKLLLTRNRWWTRGFAELMKETEYKILIELYCRNDLLRRAAAGNPGFCKFVHSRVDEVA